MQPVGEEIPQKEPLYQAIHGKGQVQNNAGGYVFELDGLKRLERFLIIGTEGSTYYANEKELKRDNVKCIDDLISKRLGVNVVQKIKEVSVQRRNLRQNSLLLALAICARSNDQDTKRAAYAVISDVCRIPTFLFMFIKFCEKESAGEQEEKGTGWGRAHKRAISKWYINFIGKPEKLARLVTKFKNREGWTHKDVLRLAHTSTKDKTVGFILRYIVKGLPKAKEMYVKEGDADQPEELQKVVELIENIERAITVTDEDEMCDLIRKWGLVREQCPSQLLNSQRVWIALLEKMPVEAMIRNLGVMSSHGLFQNGSDDERMVLEKIRNINSAVEEPMEYGEDRGPDTPKRKDILHPFRILLALETYRRCDAGGHKKGSTRWTPNQNIVRALDEAFYAAFDQVEPTGKKFYLAVDVSGSMNTPVLGASTILCSTAAAAMMMVTARTEEKSIIKGFCDIMKDLNITRDDTLESVQTKVNRMTFGATDCAKPMLDAIENKIKDIDCFIVYTDCETWAGRIHPSTALQRYRQYSERKDAKLIVCGMCSSEFTIADQEDPCMLDISGFDSSAPSLITEFVSNRV